ncbi:MAG: phosphatidylserine decarboxylase [Gammaproteobacteria bacterium]|mgnify:CR=1 FL=1|nr:phosphatidylserine decarboxylase [Gammaproteobacteria bacterium]MDX5374779.1 phosphatidylserine decarboxylase [Gammaproteobacteria bacterium]
MFPIAREARLFVLVLLAVAVLASIYLPLVVAAVFWLLLLLLAFLLRDLRRLVPSRPLAVVSPVDGVVTSVSQARDPYLKREALVIRIRQRWFGEFNVHSPVEGKITERWWPERTREDEDELPPGHFAIWMQTDEGDDAVVAIDLQGRFRLMHCSAQAGERTGQGRRCGLMGFGRPVTVYLPATARVAVAPGQPLLAGSDVIASFVHG